MNRTEPEPELEPVEFPLCSDRLENLIDFTGQAKARKKALEITTMRENLPQEIQTLIGQCEIGQKYFTNDEMSAALHCAELLQERSERLESVISYALTVEARNTREWMAGLRDKINHVLAADADHRRCTFDGRELRLRSIRDVVEKGCE